MLYLWPALSLASAAKWDPVTILTVGGAAVLFFIKAVDTIVKFDENWPKFIKLIGRYWAKIASLFFGRSPSPTRPGGTPSGAQHLPHKQAREIAITRTGRQLRVMKGGKDLLNDLLAWCARSCDSLSDNDPSLDASIRSNPSIFVIQHLTSSALLKSFSEWISRKSGDRSSPHDKLDQISKRRNKAMTNYYIDAEGIWSTKKHAVRYALGSSEMFGANRRTSFFKVASSRKWSFDWVGSIVRTMVRSGPPRLLTA